jgi:hypothetical protein
VAGAGQQVRASVEQILSFATDIGRYYVLPSSLVRTSNGWTTGLETVQYTFPNFNGRPGWEQW